MSDKDGRINPLVDGLQCIRCGNAYPVADYFEGCPDCFRIGMPSSVAVRFRSRPRVLQMEHLDDWLAIQGGSMLGEGRTPLIALPELSVEFGIDALHVKYEGANPTGSHKDRMSAAAVRRAQAVGARCVAAASSGNAGVSLAAYAARAGLDCVIVTTPDMDTSFRRAVQMHGARLIATETVEERWLIMSEFVRNGEGYPVTNHLTPPVGSHPFGVDAYRAIALELFNDMRDDLPTDVLVPSSRGDLLWGLARGFCDLNEAGLTDQVPKVHAVEPFPRLAMVLAGADYRESFPGRSQMTSLGGSTVTYQAKQALGLCGGSALPVEENIVRADQELLAREGLYLELSSAAALTGLRRLCEVNAVGPKSRVVLLATSHGYKESTAFDVPIELVNPMQRQ